MSDILDRAEAIRRNAKSEWAVRSVQAAEALDLLPELMAEIKRLREDRRILMSDNVMTEYISRLEAAYLESEEERITRASYSIDGIIYADRMAREALEKIRGEQE
jgi:hypothetical protein